MFVESPTEQTTAITDLFLSMQAMGAIWLLRRRESHALFGQVSGNGSSACLALQACSEPISP